MFLYRMFDDSISLYVMFAEQKYTGENNSEIIELHFRETP